MKYFKVSMNTFTVEAKDRDHAVDIVGEMIMPSPCGLFEFEEVEKEE